MAPVLTTKISEADNSVIVSLPSSILKVSEPAPPVNVASSPTVNVPPSFVIVAVARPCDTVTPIVISSSILPVSYTHLRAHET